MSSSANAFIGLSSAANAMPRRTPRATPSGTPHATPLGSPRAMPTVAGGMRRVGLFTVPNQASPCGMDASSSPWAKPSSDVLRMEHSQQPQPQQQERETWIVMELCDAGSLAVAVQRGEFHARTTGAVDMVSGAWRAVGSLWDVARTCVGNGPSPSLGRSRTGDPVS
jgi:hypothetical protein